MRGRTRTGKDVPCRVCGKVVYRHPSTLTKTLCSLACRSADKLARRINHSEGTAKCPRCREWLPISNFVRGSKGLPSTYCKPCSSEWFHERRGTPEEKRKPYRPAYRLTPEEKKQNKRDANRRQHMMRRAAGKSPGQSEINKMLCLQDYECRYCGVYLVRELASEYHIDHIVPVSRGGSNEIENLQILCPRCNVKKGAMTHEEYVFSLQHMRLKGAA